MADLLGRIVSISSSLSADPAFSSANFLFRNGSIMTVDTQVINLQELRQSFTNSGNAVGRQLVRFNPGFVLMGPGGVMPTTNPEFRLGHYFRMCGMQETSLSSSSSLRYKFRSSNFESGFVNVQYQDLLGTSSIITKATKVQGTCVIAGSAGQVITVDPTLTGSISQQPTRQTAVTPTMPTGGNLSRTMQTEAATIAGLTGGLTQTIKWKSFSIDFGIDIQEDLDANSTDGFYGVLIGGRSPIMQMVINLDSTDGPKFYTDLDAGTIHTWTWTHGNAASNRFHFQVRGQLNNVTIAEDATQRTAQLDYALVATTEEDELQITLS